MPHRRMPDIFDRLLSIEWAFAALFIYQAILRLYFSPEYTYPNNPNYIFELLGIPDSIAGTIAAIMGCCTLTYRWHMNRSLRNVANIIMATIWINYIAAGQYMSWVNDHKLTNGVPTIGFALILIYVSVAQWNRRL